MEIKFRGKTLKGNRWAKGNGIEITPNFAIIPHRTRRGIEKKRVSLETVGQYLGRNDCNGVKIYEGDIIDVRYFSHAGEVEETKRVIVKVSPRCVLVEREKDVCGFVLGLPRYDDWLDWYIISDDGLEIIGNIHDNPELLEKK